MWENLFFCGQDTHEKERWALRKSGGRKAGKQLFLGGLWA
jgi:hypothetical protein